MNTGVASVSYGFSYGAARMALAARGGRGLRWAPGVAWGDGLGR